MNYNQHSIRLDKVIVRFNRQYNNNSIYLFYKPFITYFKDGVF